MHTFLLSVLFGKVGFDSVFARIFSHEPCCCDHIFVLRTGIGFSVFNSVILIIKALYSMDFACVLSYRALNARKTKERNLTSD